METKLRANQIGEYIMFESYNEAGRNIGIMPNGELKSAMVAGRDMSSHFAIRIVVCITPIT